MIVNQGIELGQLKPKQQVFQLKKSTFNIETPRKNLTCISIYEDTMYLGTRQSKLYIYRLDGINFVDQKVLIPHCQIVSSVTANDVYFITVAQSDDQMPVSVWNAKTRMFITALKSHESQVSKVIFLSEPGWIATSSWDCTVKIWDLRNILQWQNNIKTIKSEYPVLTITQISEDIVAFGGDDCYINFWNWKTLEFMGKYFAHAGSLTLIYSFQNHILTAGGDHKIKQWQFKMGLNPNERKMQEVQNGKAQQQVVDGQQKAIVKITRQIKKSYDSSIFLIMLNPTDLFLLDRHGARFLHRLGKDFISCPNNFQYNQNITGMVIYKQKIYVTTTKGELKCFEIQMVKNPFQANFQ